MTPMQVGAKGGDAAYPPPPSAVAQAGLRFMCRYSNGRGEGTSGKLCGQNEILAYTALGVDFLANMEDYESTPQEGAASGKLRGQRDRDFWQARGLAPGAGVLVSWEPGNDTSKWPAVSAFIEAYKAALGRPVGMYAGLPTLLEFRRRGLIDATWLPMSSAASNLYWGDIPQSVYAAKLQQVGRDNGINIVQNRNYWFNKTVDEDVYTTAFPVPFSHLQALHPAPPPPPPPTQPKEVDMFIAITVVDSHGAPIPSASQVRCLFGPGFHKHGASAVGVPVMSHAGVPTVTVNQAQHDFLVSDMRDATVQQTRGSR